MIHSPPLLSNISRLRHRFTAEEFARMIDLTIPAENQPLELMRGEVVDVANAIRYRFSVDEYERMIESGILTEDKGVELIRGEILNKMAIGDLHCAYVKRLNACSANFSSIAPLLGFKTRSSFQRASRNPMFPSRNIGKTITLPANLVLPISFS